MPRILLILLVMIVVLYLGACVVLYAFQSSLIYFPQPRSVGTSATILELPVADVNVLVSVRPHDGPKALIYLGGNAEDVSQGRGPEALSAGARGLLGASLGARCATYFFAKSL